jgi:tetratricopeptide (TPR) repeat protein
MIGVTLFFVACSPIEDPDSAIPRYSATLVADPNDATALVNRCAHDTASARYENAVADCTRALHLQPNSVDARQNRAAAYQRWGRLEEALMDWEEVLAQIETSEFWHKTSPERIEYARQQVRLLRAQLESNP